MATLAAGDHVRLALTGGGVQSTVHQNVMHMEVLTGTGIDPDDVAGSVAANLAVGYVDINSLVNDEFQYDQIEVWKRDKINHVWDGVSAISFTPVGGVSVADVNPHGVAMVCRYVTEQLRRQGRHFVPGLTNLASTDGLWAAATLTAFGLYMVDLFEDISPAGGTLRFCTYNDTFGSVHYETASLAVASYLINEIPGYQRRRKPLVGI